MIGKKYILRPANRNAWQLMSFDGLPVKKNTVLKVVETEVANFNGGILGAKSIEINGVIYTINPDHLQSWAYFTECMTDNEEYGIYTVREITNEIGEENLVDKDTEEVGETGYLMKGKNGERLMESVSKIRRVSGVTQVVKCKLSGTVEEVSFKAETDSLEDRLCEKFNIDRDCRPVSHIGIGTRPSITLAGDWKPEDVEKVKVAFTKFSDDYVKSLQDRYDEWVLENVHVYELFCKFTLQAIASGKKKISHWLIVNRLRWEVEIETKGVCEEDKDYKISNDYIAFLARDFIKDYPEHSEIFNLKQMKRV